MCNILTNGKTIRRLYISTITHYTALTDAIQQLQLRQINLSFVIIYELLLHRFVCKYDDAKIVDAYFLYLT